MRRSIRTPMAALALLPLLSCSDPQSPVDQTPGAADPAKQNRASGAGDYALDFLSDATFGSLIVEVDYIAGRDPSPAALDALVAALGDLCRKPGGIQVIVDDEIPSPGTSVWSLSAIDALESAHRDRYRDPDSGAAVLYAVYVDGRSDHDSGSSKVLGTAYHGSSVVIFAETIESVQPGVPLYAPIEDTVLIHEAGHLLGLVNNGTAMEADHQDTAHGAHDDNPDCIMYWAVETQNVVDVLLSGKPDFDAACRADLAAATP